MIPRERFLNLIRNEVLRLQDAELDFGIYRILNYRRREIEEWLDTELPKEIDKELSALPDAATEDEQARIFNALYTFLSRYYDDGDFMPRARRGRDAAYSVPYNGEDVHFHWATKGSHYVKSGERFGAYVYRDGDHADSAKVRIVVAEADVEKDNVKGDKRYYVPVKVEEAKEEIHIVLAWRKLDAAEQRRFGKQSAGDIDDGNRDADDILEGVEGRDPQVSVVTGFDGLIFTLRDGGSCLPSVDIAQTLGLLAPWPPPGHYSCHLALS